MRFIQERGRESDDNLQTFDVRHGIKPPIFYFHLF